MSGAFKINDDGTLGWETTVHKYNAIPTRMCLKCCWSIPASQYKPDDRCCKTDMHLFHSKRESVRYQELRMMEKAGLIGPIKLQPVFKLPEGFLYKADFSYTDRATRKRVWEDVKGFQTKEFKLKLKCIRHAFPKLDLRIIK